MLVEGLLQFADLLRGKLGPHPALLGRFPLAVIPNLALRPGGVAATVCKEKENLINPAEIRPNTDTKEREREREKKASSTEKLYQITYCLAMSGIAGFSIPLHIPPFGCGLLNEAPRPVPAE